MAKLSANELMSLHHIYLASKPKTKVPLPRGYNKLMEHLGWHLGCDHGEVFWTTDNNPGWLPNDDAEEHLYEMHDEMHLRSAECWDSSFRNPNHSH